MAGGQAGTQGLRQRRHQPVAHQGTPKRAAQLVLYCQIHHLMQGHAILAQPVDLPQPDLAAQQPGEIGECLAPLHGRWCIGSGKAALPGILAITGDKTG